MSQSSKAAWIALSIVVLLTIAKFVLYRVSGSIAVLSEAWHSIADIATTLLVLLSIIRQERKCNPEERLDAATQQGDEQGESPKGITAVLRSGFRWFRAINTELKIAVIIGLLLNIAAVAIFWRGVMAEQVEVAAPLVTGLIFTGLSFGSFFLSRFEEQIGELENSAALTADSHHNRADMAISLLTGLSLILYHFGIDLDRWVGILIAAYIFTFASELLVNSVQAIARNRQDITFNYRFTSIIWRVYQPNTYHTLFQLLDARVNFSDRLKKLLKTIPGLTRWTLRWTFRTTLAAGIILYLSTLLYTVDQNEKALLLRFGRLVNQTQDIGPGLHLKLPYPIDRAVRIKTEAIQTLVVGNPLVEKSAMIWTREHGDNRTFISGDNNLFLPYIVIHYRVKSLHDYYLTHADGVPDRVLGSLSLQMLNHLFLNSTFYDLILTERESWTWEFQEQLQRKSDQLNIGIEIVEFCLRDLHPPAELAGAYEKVIAAGQIKEAKLNDAERKVNALLTRERIAKMRTVGEAESYVVEKKKTAQGEAANYLLRYSGYTEGGEVMKNILLLKASALTLENKKIYLVDPNSGIDDKLLYIEKYMTGLK